MIGEVYPWQVVAHEAIVRQAAAGRLHHALLLVGEPGVGKLDLALRIANLLLCREPAGGSPCGTCQGCRLVDAGTHPDLRLLQPEESRFIVIDQIRELVDWEAQTAQQGGRKVVILHPAEAINHAASNALLKCLEEPAADTTLILVCNRLSALLPTVRSRCQRFTIARPGREAAVAWLKQAMGAGVEVEPLLDFAQDRPLAARTIADGSFLEVRKRLFGAIRALRAGTATPLDCAAALDEGDLESLLNLLLLWLKDLLAWKLTADEKEIKNKDLTGLVKEIATRLDSADVLRMVDLVNEERALVASSVTPNRQLILESLMIEWAGLGR